MADLESPIGLYTAIAVLPERQSTYCLHLFRLRRGEFRDADHWMCQALDLDYDVVLDLDIAFARRPTWPVQPRVRHPQALREAVERLEVEHVHGEFHHPDQALADQLEEFSASC
ncbi:MULTISPECIES: hypothetical protein [unclassified Streptomyces]|uniref:hypothetical protein n=1 Tax=unclassified Streptomyces TaxID=2593676 RepID=UPI003332B067